MGLVSVDLSMFNMQPLLFCSSYSIDTNTCDYIQLFYFLFLYFKFLSNVVLVLYKFGKMWCGCSFCLQLNMYMLLLDSGSLICVDALASHLFFLFIFYFMVILSSTLLCLRPFTFFHMYVNMLPSRRNFITLFWFEGLLVFLHEL